MDEKPIIEIENVSFRYRGAKRNALENLNLSVQSGEFVAVVGPSLAGKSTLCLLMNGLIPHSIKGKMTNDVFIKGVSTKQSSVNHLFKDVAIVFQDFETQLFSTCAALDVAFGPENLGLSHDVIVKRVKDCLDLVGLSGFENRESMSMSGGQKQRLAIASALALKSSILVMDEPTTDLDPIGKQDVLDVANSFRLRGEQTIICVEHEVEELVHANRVIVMNQGQIIMDGSPEDVFIRVEELEANGVRPLDTCALMSKLGINSPALTVDDALSKLISEGFQINEKKFEDLVKTDIKRSTLYGDKAIEIKNLCFSYDNTSNVIDNVSLDIRKGEFVAIVGQNGSGKTTLTKQINGLLKFDSGDITVFGDSVKESGIFNLSKNIGYVFQNPDNQIFADTVYDEVSFGPKNYGFSKNEIDEMVDEALVAVDLLDCKEMDPFSLTKGERQRVAVASILSMRPNILILDEPTTGLDYLEQISIMELLTKLNRAGSTIIIVTHTMWVVSQYAHRAIVMNKGKIVFDDTVRNVFKNESELSSFFLKPPQISQIGNRLSHTFLSVEEAINCLELKMELGDEADNKK